MINRCHLNRRCFLQTGALGAASALIITPLSPLCRAGCSPKNSRVNVYDLGGDCQGIESTQEASLQGDYGLDTKPALFGSNGWWQLLGTEKLPLYTIEGVISEVYMSGHNDFPEFEVDDGTVRTQWMRLGDDSVYFVGRPVRLQYVEMKFKKVAGKRPVTDDVCECVVRIDMGELS